MSKLNPYFDLDGRRYEIKCTRYLAVEHEKMAESLNLSNEDRIANAKYQNKLEQLIEIAEQLKVLKTAYYEDMTNQQAKAQYKACLEEYNELYDETTALEINSGATVKARKAVIDMLERLAILALSEQHFNNDYAKAKTVWEEFASSVGKDVVIEWLVAMNETFFTNDEEEVENSFLTQMRAKREEQEANRKKGLNKINR